ncbi:MAG: DUF2027 domain-containing protein [Muribaculaceae bacterium]|nr:DUF2027 domain-containing protein [Muribaculaceae bacterium]
MVVKVGDTVRYLNSVGGGIVTRISDGIAYVDDDGFETPVLIRECVVVGSSMENTPKSASTNVDNKPYSATPIPPSKAADLKPEIPIIETATGNILNIVLGFEANNIKALSHSSFDAYLVNDSNYYLYTTISTRSNDKNEWALRYDGLIEPNIQEFVFELENIELAHLDHIAVQYIAFKRDKAFESKSPAIVDLKVDASKFAKLHCFRPNAYFDVPVIAFDIATDDKATFSMPEIDAEKLAIGMREKKSDVSSQRRHEQRTANSKSSKVGNEPLVVDLHAAELIDSTAGLTPADILNLQIDRFAQVMDENRRFPGRKIVFIHGKGEGVLRQALMKELSHRYKGHDVQDASFREYGFGATQVTIRQLDKNYASINKKQKGR